MHSEQDYPKEIRANKEFRLHVLQQAENDKELQELLIRKCKEDILFLVNVFCWTYDPRKTPSNLPFITYPFQDETLLNIVRCIKEGRDVAIEKSRDMGASWMIVVVMVYGFLNGWASLYGSYKQDYVDKMGDMDSHFERIRFVLELLPEWLLPKDVQQTFMKISSREKNCSISGDAGANFGTGGRRKFVVHDEFALWQHDEKAFRKTKDISRCRIYLGTPEGKFNVYGQIMTKSGSYENLDIERIRLHWSLHPEKDQEWYEEQKKTRTKLDIAKELDISYDDSVTGAVYPEFTDRVIINDVKFDPKLPLFTAWDFGRDMNAVLWLQKDYYSNMVHIIDAYQVKDKPIEFMSAFIIGKPSIDPVTGVEFHYDHEELLMIERHKDWVSSYTFHCGDPYNANATQTNATSSIKQKLAQDGIYVRTKTGTTVEERIRQAHLALPRLVVNKNLMHFLQSMTQARYPEKTLTSTREKTKPIHDETSHFRTAFEYWCDNEPVKNPFEKKKRQHNTVKRFNPLTGKPM